MLIQFVQTFGTHGKIAYTNGILSNLIEVGFLLTLDAEEFTRTPRWLIVLLFLSPMKSVLLYHCYTGA